MIKTYTVANDNELKTALCDIIKGGVNAILKDVAKEAETLFAVFDIAEDVREIYCHRSYGKDYGETARNTISGLRLDYLGTYANGFVYDPHFYCAGVSYDEAENVIPVRSIKYIEEKGKCLSECVIAQIVANMMNKYPTLETIPSEFASGVYFSENDVLACIRGDKFSVDFTPIVDYKISVYDVISYDRAKSENREESFIADLSQRIQEQHLDSFCRKLASYYKLVGEARKALENATDEDRLYLEICGRIKDFIDKQTKEIKNLKFFIAGKDEMLDRSTKGRFPDFSIENKAVEMTAPPDVLINRYKPEHGVFESPGWQCSLVPVLKERYGNRNVDYIESFSPSSITRITYGKNVIYEKAQ